jgi:thioesterase domain-containing protein/acyl carrier protein
MVPAAFEVLDTLPRTPNAKVDRRALPAPTRADGASRYVAPRDALERQLATIWERELGIAPIGSTDNFFDLGGHSLLAVRIFSQIEKALGKRLPLATLFTAPTIAQLAAILRQKDWAPAWRALVAIQPHGTRPPLFCIHAHGGHVLLYHELARRLGPDQPVYGLQAIGLDGQHAPYKRIEDMARHYVAELRSVQPHGPYFLAGDCLGGTLAYEVGRQLHEQGDEVALLAMFDAFRPGYPKLRRGVPRAAFAAVHRLRILAFHGRTLLWLGRNKRWPYLAERVQRVSFALGARVGRRLGTPSPLLRTQAALTEAYAVYAPPPYAGQITLLRSSSLPLGIETAPALGWEGLAAGGVQVHELPYYFTTGLTGANVAILARELRACLDRRIAAGRPAPRAAARRGAR